MSDQKEFDEKIAGIRAGGIQRFHGGFENKLYTDDLNILFDAIETQKAFDDLDLKYNKRSIILERLSDLLQKKDFKLRSLSVNFENSSAEDVHTFLESLENSDVLRNLDITFSAEQSDVVLSDINTLLQHNTYLHTLGLHNRNGGADFSLIAPGIKENNTLSTLTLNSAESKDRHPQRLIKAIKANNGLQGLCLNDAMTPIYLDSLEHNEKILDLWLSETNEQSVEKLTKFLKMGTNLAHLTMSCGKASEESVRKLLNTVSPQMACLCLMGGHSDSVLKQIETAFVGNDSNNFFVVYNEEKSDSLHALCTRNRERVFELKNKMIIQPGSLTDTDFKDIADRIPALRYMLAEYFGRSECAAILVDIRNRAQEKGIEIHLPGSFSQIANKVSATVIQEVQDNFKHKNVGYKAESRNLDILFAAAAKHTNRVLSDDILASLFDDSNVFNIANRAWREDGDRLFQHISWNLDEINNASSPAVILHGYSKLDASLKEFEIFNTHLCEQLKRQSDDNYRNSNKELIKYEPPENIETRLGGAGGMAFLLEALSEGGAPGSAGLLPKMLPSPQQPGTNNNALVAISHEIESVNAYLSTLQQSKHADLKSIGKDQARFIFLLKLYSLRSEHVHKIFNQFTSYVSDHHTTTDAVFESLLKENPDCAASFIAFLKGDYRVEDIQKLYEFANAAPVGTSPAQHAFLQFVNHDVIPHLDFFEIWASKLYDLESAQERVLNALKAKQFGGIPKLEILGQKNIQLSGRISEKARPIADTPEKGKALLHGLAMHDDARNKVIMLMHELKDASNGDLKFRHKHVKDEALAQIEKFNKFFNGIDGALKEIDSQVGIKTGARGNTWQAFLGAEAIANQIEVLKYNSPENLEDHYREMLWKSSGARVLSALGRMDPWSALGEIASEITSGEIRNHHTIKRYKTEFDMRIKSLQARQTGDPAELKNAVNKLDHEIEALLSNKKFISSGRKSVP